MTISEIAYKTGFNDPVYFARLFKQRTGMTPKAYREKKIKLLPRNWQLHKNKVQIPKTKKHLLQTKNKNNKNV